MRIKIVIPCLVALGLGGCVMGGGSPVAKMVRTEDGRPLRYNCGPMYVVHDGGSFVVPPSSTAVGCQGRYAVMNRTQGEALGTSIINAGSRVGAGLAQGLATRPTSVVTQVRQEQGQGQSSFLGNVNTNNINAQGGDACAGVIVCRR